MKRTELDRNILTVEKFLDAATEADLAVILERFGIGGERLDELGALLQSVKNARLVSDLQLGRQKALTSRKDELKRKLSNEISRLADLIRSRYPKAKWLSQLGLETRYATVDPPLENASPPSGEESPESGGVRRKAVPRGRSEAEFRGRCFVLLENLSELDVEVLAFLSGRGWTTERIDGVKALLAEFVAVCEERDSNRRLSRQANTGLTLAVKSLGDLYRSYARQLRVEAGDDPAGQKLVAATTAWSW